MMVFKKNLAVLKESQPEVARLVENHKRPADLESLKTTKGLPVSRYKGKSLHSRFDPHREAALWASGCSEEPKVIFGLGDAYHIEAFLDRPGADGLVVVEPDGGLIRGVLEERDLSQVLNRIRLVAGQAPGEAVEQLPGEDASLFVHPPSGQIHVRYLEALRALWSYQIHDGQDLRILVVGPIYGGSYPIACFVEQALTGLGHTVSFADLSPFYPGYQEIQAWDQGAGLLSPFEQVISWLIEQRAQAFSPDLILFLAQAPVNEESLTRLREQGIRLAYWFVEDYQRMTYWQRLAPVTDVFFTIQRQGQEEIRASGAPCVRYLPMAALSGTHEPLGLNPDDSARYGSSVSFVGAGYPNRRRFLARLSTFELKIWGNEWDGPPAVLVDKISEEGRRVSAEETVKIFNATRVNLNLHSSTYHEEVDPHGDFVNPRTFELASCQAFQLVDKRSLLGELFNDKEIVVFDDLKDAREKIEYFLEHDPERGIFAQRARERVLQEHTYRLRMKELLGVLYERGLEKRRTGRTAGEWIQETQDQELRQFLSQFPEEGELDLDEMTAWVRSKDGFAWADRVFLTLMAFREGAR